MGGGTGCVLGSCRVLGVPRPPVVTPTPGLIGCWAPEVPHRNRRAPNCGVGVALLGSRMSEWEAPPGDVAARERHGDVVIVARCRHTSQVVSTTTCIRESEVPAPATTPPALQRLPSRPDQHEQQHEHRGQAAGAPSRAPHGRCVLIPTPMDWLQQSFATSPGTARARWLSCDCDVTFFSSAAVAVPAGWLLSGPRSYPAV